MSINQTKTGELIRRIRTEMGLTQANLAEMLSVSDKTVSKWECGGGLPDISIIPALSEALGIEMQSLISGGCEENGAVSGSMKKLVFYVCPICGNVVFQLGNAAVSCCGREMTALSGEKTENADLNVQRIENEYYISSEHEMTREHYISFAAFVTGDSFWVKKLYPEWNCEFRLPFPGHGTLFWYCTRHGVKEKYI